MKLKLKGGYLGYSRTGVVWVARKGSFKKGRNVRKCGQARRND